jgi:Tat protein translocase TatB subunit
MFGSFGGSEILLILVLALILFGPRRLPQIGKMVGRAMSEFRGAASEFRSSLEREVEIQEFRELRAETEAAVRGVPRRPGLPPAAPPARPAPGIEEPVEEPDDGAEPGVRPPAGV